MPLYHRLARVLASLGLTLAALAPDAASAAGSPPNLPSLSEPPATDPPADPPPADPPADPPPDPPPDPPADTPPDPPADPPVDPPADPPLSASEAPPPIQRPASWANPTPARTPVPNRPTPAPAPVSPTPAPAPVSPTPAPVPSASPAPTPAASASPAPGEPTASTPPRDDPKRWRHGGFILDLQIGTGGCTRRYCSGSAGHDAAPGLRLGGFVGANIFGILEVGIATGWNTLRPRGVVGDNALNLYGLDPAQVQVAIAEAMGVPALAVDLSTLTVQGASARAFNVGPSLRVHFIRKGRGIAYIGADIHYQLWRNRYSTASGDLRLDFHGVSAPLRAGGGVYVHRNLAIVGEFSYVPTVFVVGGIRHPMLTAVAPLQALEGQAAEVSNSGSLKSGLPHFWNVSLNLRLRF